MKKVLADKLIYECRFNAVFPLFNLLLSMKLDFLLLSLSICLRENKKLFFQDYNRIMMQSVAHN